MAYFDLHCHPGLKTLFQLQNGNQISVWDNISTGALGSTLGSQSSLKQIMQNRNMNLVCLTLHPPEKGMINQFVLFLGAITVFKSFINLGRLKTMCSSESRYQDILSEEFFNISHPAKPSQNLPTKTRVKFLKKWSEYNAADFDTLHVVFNIEGGHTFYDLGNKVENMDVVLKNFDDFLDKGYKVLYFTPTHLTPNEFITHAYGNKILSKGQLLPKGIGITPFGKKFINHAYSKGVLIDIKHMSLVSRRIFYRWREINNITEPIVASHIGLSGNRWNIAFENPPENKYKSYGYKVFWERNPAPVENTWFYPLSINLYNEDIEYIIKSKGLIGISLDVRILGGAKGGLQKDFFSHEEFEMLIDKNNTALIETLAVDFNNNIFNNGNSLLDSRNLEAEDEEDFEETTQELSDILYQSQPVSDSVNYHKHLNLIINHIVRIFQICDWANAGNPENHICIGSDFDGLIEPLDCCRNASEFHQFATALTAALQTAIPKYMPNDYKNLNATELVKKIMYENAVNFMSENL